MKSRIHLKLLMAPLSMLTLLACSPNQYQQVSEYDDVYFTSADRQRGPSVVVKPDFSAENDPSILTLENKSEKSVDQKLVTKYNNSSSEAVEYFVQERTEPKVKKPNQLNYDDFLWDYENELLATYTLPLDWETEWDRAYFNDLIRSDFEFRLAWYDQYYVGNSDRMDRYINATNGQIGSATYANFTRPRVGVNIGVGSFVRPSIGVTFGFGFRNAFGFYDYDPFFNDPFVYSSFYDPYFVGSIWRWNRWSRRNRRFWGRFYDPYYYCPPIFSNQYIYRGDVIVARNNRTITRGGRVRSTSVSSVRSDANNGIAPTRSQRISSASGASSRLTRSTIASRSSRSGRVSSSNSTRTNVSARSSANRNSVANLTRTRSSRTRTDAYRFDDRNGRSSETRLNGTNGRSRSSNIVNSRSRGSRNPRSSSTVSRSSTNRSSSNRNGGVSFNRSSSRSSSTFNRSRSSSRSSSSGVSRSSSRSSSRSGSVSRSSSRSGSSRGSVSRSSSSRSSRSSSGGSRSSSSSGSGRRN